MTGQELSQTFEIMQKFLGEEKALEFFSKLDEEVGKKSEDQNLKTFLRKVIDKPVMTSPWWLWGSFYILVAAHVLMILAIFMSFLVLPFYAPWYIAVPLMTFIFFFSSTRVECQITNLENYLRRRLGLRRIGGFVGTYFIKPAKHLYRKVFNNTVQIKEENINY